MLRQRLIHPEILGALASAGHGSKILISDFNYAHAPLLGPNATLVFANFAPQLMPAVPILELIAAAVPIESASVMAPARSGPYAVEGDPPVWSDYRRVLGERADYRGEFDELERFAFYEAASDSNVCLTVATGETAYYACLLLTIGAFQPDM